MDERKTTQATDLAKQVKDQADALAKEPMSPEATVRAMIAGNMNRIEQSLPAAGLTPERLATMTFNAIRKVPALMQCDGASLIGCILKSAELGLNPGILGHAHLIPYGKEATFIIGYQGMLELARRSGEIQSIYAKPVYKEDQFHYAFGLKPDLVHVPFDGPQDTSWDNVTHVYMVARFTNGGYHFGVMTKAQVEDHRDRYAKGLEKKSNGQYTSPWKTAPIPMALKTIIRQEWKWLPVSVDIRSAVAEVEEAEVEVLEGRSHVWTSVTAGQMLDDAKPAALPEIVQTPACEPVPEDAPTDPQDAPEPEKAAKTGTSAKKAAPKAEPAAPGPVVTKACCHTCGFSMTVTDDATEADVAKIICPGCGVPDLSLNPLPEGFTPKV
jgi:recombination protein RecT